MKVTTLKYSYKIIEIIEKHQCFTSTGSIKEREIEFMNFECLFLDSLELFPLYVIRKSEIIQLELHTHLDMNEENFEILNNLYESGTQITFHHERYEDWFNGQKRMKTIGDIIR